MKAITKFLGGGVAVAALASAAPAAAQYYPGYGYGYGGGYGAANVVGQIINSVVGGGYNGYAPYGNNSGSQFAVNQCASAVQARLAGGNGGYGGYGAYGGGYGYNSYGGGRVLGISRVDQGLAGAINVRGVATSGGYNNVPDLTWKCKADPRGGIISLDVRAAQRAYGGYGYVSQQYTPWNDYSQYGYRRY